MDSYTYTFRLRLQTYTIREGWKAAKLLLLKEYECVYDEEAKVCSKNDAFVNLWAKWSRPFGRFANHIQLLWGLSFAHFTREEILEGFEPSIGSRCRGSHWAWSLSDLRPSLFGSYPSKCSHQLGMDWTRSQPSVLPAASSARCPSQRPSI